MAFSVRTSWDTSESDLARGIRERRAAGLEMFDLTLSNPTVCGFDFDGAAILGALSDPAALTYDPEPRGLASAREAVAGYYRERGAALDADDLLLTTSTSEAYSFLFRLLCDAGHEVLAPQPSYPLFDFLADLDDVVLASYPLFYDFGWWIDFAELERRITPRSRAILVVHPNNPTGHMTRRPERERLEELCARRGLALIVDEVFLDYGLEQEAESFAAGPHPCLTFVLSGLSKIAALPQMKAAWIAVFGPDRERAEALRRLEIVADTFLSMNAPAQLALPAWLGARKAIQGQILARVRENRDRVPESLQMLPVEAGWSAVLRLPQWAGDGAIAERLVRTTGVVVHPGSFYGFAGQHSVVISLIGRPEVFFQGMEKLKRWCEPGELTRGAAG
jgi:aspartate/methionine/tyrosine aminotransferase